MRMSKNGKEGWVVLERTNIDFAAASHFQHYVSLWEWDIYIILAKNCIGFFKNWHPRVTPEWHHRVKSSLLSLEVYYKVDSLLTGLTDQQSVITAWWYSNKSSLMVIYIENRIFKLSHVEVNQANISLVIFNWSQKVSLSPYPS